MLALRQNLDPRQRAPVKSIHGEIVVLMEGQGEIRSPGGASLECMRVELGVVLKGWSRLPVTSTGPEGGSVSALAQAMNGGVLHRVRHSQNPAVEQEGQVGSPGYREAWASVNPGSVASAL